MQETDCPLARCEGLCVEEFDGEIVVYDLAAHKVHCLNRLSAAVWRHCDGHTPVALIVRRLAATSDVFSANVVDQALNLLAARGLLSGQGPAVGGRGHTRRKILQAGVAALAPAILTVVAPTPAQAQSAADSTQPVGDPGKPKTDSRGGRGRGKGRGRARGLGRGASKILK